MTSEEKLAKEAEARRLWNERIESILTNLDWLDAQFGEARQQRGKFVTEFALIPARRARSIIDRVTRMFGWPEKGSSDFWEDPKRTRQLEDFLCREFSIAESKYLLPQVKRFYPFGPRYIQPLEKG
jgi:hypothetical protein